MCERWLREKRPVAWVLDHLEEVNFDPEFSRRYDDAMARTFRGQLS